MKGLSGKIRIRITNRHLERTISSAASKGLRLTSVRRTSSDSAEATLTLEDFRLIRPILRANHSRIRILKRSGAAFLWADLAHRIFLVAGMLAVLILILLATSIVWDIRVEGNSGYGPEIEAILAENGARRGSWKSKLALADLEGEIQRQIPQLSWVAVKTDGIYLIADARASTSAPELYERAQPGDVVAQKPGMVHEIVVFEGTAAVKPGQQVKPGDVLIRGEITLRDGSIQQVRAQGAVTARNWVKGSGAALPYLEIRTDTGHTSQQRNITLAGWRIEDPTPVDFADYRLEERQISLLGGLFFPARCVEITAYEQSVIYDVRSLEEMQGEALGIAEAEALQRIGETRVIDKRSEYVIMDDGILYAQVYLETLEDIVAPHP